MSIPAVPTGNVGSAFPEQTKRKTLNLAFHLGKAFSIMMALWDRLCSVLGKKKWGWVCENSGINTENTLATNMIAIHPCEGTLRRKLTMLKPSPTGPTNLHSNPLGLECARIVALRCQALLLT